MRKYYYIIILLLAVVCARADAVIASEDSAQVCFTPGSNCTGFIVSAIGRARSEILVQAYSFTSQPIAKALVNAHRRGVSVIVIVDKSNDLGKRYSAAVFLANSGIPTYIDRSHKIAHNKVMVIDASIVITGSFNFTKAAQTSNAENVLLIADKALAVKYRANFNRHLAHSDKAAARY